ARARRRVEEPGDPWAAAALAERDERDSAQTIHAPDAVVIDSTDLELDAVVARIVELARAPPPGANAPPMTHASSRPMASGASGACACSGSSRGSSACVS